MSRASCFFLVQYAHGRHRLGDQRAIGILRLAFDEAETSAILQHARLGIELGAVAGADERGRQIDGDDADRLRVQRARRGAERDIEERDDDAAVHRAEAVGEMRLDRQRQARRAFAERLDEDPQVRDERNALLIFAREFNVHMMVAPRSTAIAWPVMCRDASEASSTARPFRSSSLPRRLVGVQSRISSPVVPSVALVILEGKNPGQIALTVMPNWPHSAASARVKLTRPPLVVL